MGWNQCHCENHQILVPTTIHKSKLELEWPRYHENRDDVSIAAQQTSESHNFWSDCWIFEFHTFLETETEYLSKGVNISPISGWLRPAAIERLLAALQWPRLIFSPEAINSPKHAPDKEKTHFSKIFFLPSYSLHFFFSLPNTKKTPKNTLKNKSKSLDSSLFAKNTRYCFCTQSSFPWFYIWIWGLGVWM